MSVVDEGSFETLVPSRFVTFTFPNPFFSAADRRRSRHHLHTPLLRVAVLDSPAQPPPDPDPAASAAILVPAGRETDWIFSTVSGHLQLLLNSPHISRLILIGNLPSHPHPSPFTRPIPIDSAQLSEFEKGVTPLLLALSPKSAFANGSPEIGFLCYEDDVVRSVIVETCDGGFVGEMLIEDVELEIDGESEFRRRLRFKRMPNLVQTQIRILPGGDTDLGFLVHPYLTPMVSSLKLVSSHLEGRIRAGFKPNALCLGVGGGALLSFLNIQLGFDVTGMEVDEVVVSVARRRFGLPENPFIRVWTGDGIKLIEELAAQDCNSESDGRFDVVMVDLDSNDEGMGTMAPSMEFVQKPVLLAARTLLREPGMLAINVIPPSRSFYEKLVLEFRQVFQELYEIDVGNAENFVLVAVTTPVGMISTESDSAFVTRLKQVISGAYMDCIRKI